MVKLFFPTIHCTILQVTSNFNVAGVSVVYEERRLTCTAPGNAPGQSCAGLRAAGTGTGQETAPRQPPRGPAAQRRPPINTQRSHCQILWRAIKL